MNVLKELATPDKIVIIVIVWVLGVIILSTVFFIYNFRKINLFEDLIEEEDGDVSEDKVLFYDYYSKEVSKLGKYFTIYVSVYTLIFIIFVLLLNWILR